jgi:hypothetical protein
MGHNINGRQETTSAGYCNRYIRAFERYRTLMARSNNNELKSALQDHAILQTEIIVSRIFGNLNSFGQGLHISCTPTLINPRISTSMTYPMPMVHVLTLPRDGFLGLAIRSSKRSFSGSIAPMETTSLAFFSQVAWPGKSSIAHTSSKPHLLFLIRNWGETARF